MMTEYQILTRIAQLQHAQKTNPPTSAHWQTASAELQKLFAEMAKRTAEVRS